MVLTNLWYWGGTFHVIYTIFEHAAIIGRFQTNTWYKLCGNRKLSTDGFLIIIFDMDALLNKRYKASSCNKLGKDVFFRGNGLSRRKLLLNSRSAKIKSF